MAEDRLDKASWVDGYRMACARLLPPAPPRAEVETIFDETYVKPLTLGQRARLCDHDHICDWCGEGWRVNHYCAGGSALCGGHSQPDKRRPLGPVILARENEGVDAPSSVEAAAEEAGMATQDFLNERHEAIEMGVDLGKPGGDYTAFIRHGRDYWHELRSVLPDGAYIQSTSVTRDEKGMYVAFVHVRGVLGERYLGVAHNAEAFPDAAIDSALRDIITDFRKIQRQTSSD